MSEPTASASAPAGSDSSSPDGSPADAEPKAGGKFGMFGGVFTPSILTILGVVMYMRLGVVTGQAGLGIALAIVIVAHLISLSTGLSVASISTNRTVGAGGAYFMISRALGGPAGAAIGIPLFFAQALSVTFYIVGFSDSVLQLVPEAWRFDFLAPTISTIINVGLTALSLKSAELAIKAQYVVMAMIVLSLVSFFLGTSGDYPREIEWINPEGPGFATLFAIFFPAVTGIMAGVSMSGDLKNPRRAIPVGTLLAIFVGFVIYLAFPIWLSLNRSNAYLTDEANTNVVFTLSRVPALIYVGVWGATLSSALGSILSAPRTLQALAVDRLAPRFLGRGYGPNNEPRIGTILTFVLAQTGIMLGSLDAIAPVLTMFFLMTYGVTNLACGLQKWAASPSFRPSFKTPAFVSLAGAAACFYVMSIINMGAMAVSAMLCGLIFIWVQRRSLGTTYGDARHGIWAALVRTSLHRLRRTEFHPLNWRPNLVIFGGPPEQRPYLLHLGASIVQDRGMVTYFHFLKGKVASLAAKRRELFEQFEPKMGNKFPNVFYRVDITDNIFRGIVNAAQSYGVGNFQANAVMVGWPKKAERVPQFGAALRDLALLDRALMVVRYHEEKRLGEGRNLHVWWRGDDGDGALMLLIAFLLTAHYRFRNMQITLLALAESDEDRDQTERRLKDLLKAARIEATPRVILRQRRTLAEVMHVESHNADLAIIGLSLPDEFEDALYRSGPTSNTPESWFAETEALLAELPTTILVRRAGGFSADEVLLEGS